MSFCRKLSFNFAVLLSLATQHQLHHSSPAAEGQTLEQEESFEACCKEKQIGFTSNICTYRELQSIFHNGLATSLPPDPRSDPLTAALAFFGCNQLNYTCANQLWPSYIECLNHGTNNRECCFATTNFKGVKFPKECTLFCNGAAPAGIDEDYLKSNPNCVDHWKQVIQCAMKS